METIALTLAAALLLPAVHSLPAATPGRAAVQAYALADVEAIPAPVPAVTGSTPVGPLSDCPDNADLSGLIAALRATTATGLDREAALDAADALEARSDERDALCARLAARARIVAGLEERLRLSAALLEVADGNAQLYRRAWQDALAVRPVGGRGPFGWVAGAGACVDAESTVRLCGFGGYALRF